jgi:hypothetical protein
MNIETFFNRLEKGKCNNYIYETDNNEGLICVWKHEGKLICTWEECASGTQYDETEYSRDERYVFDDSNSFIEFLQSHNIQPELFTP